MQSPTLRNNVLRVPQNCIAFPAIYGYLQQGLQHSYRVPGCEELRVCAWLCSNAMYATS